MRTALTVTYLWECTECGKTESVVYSCPPDKDWRISQCPKPDGWLWVGDCEIICQRHNVVISDKEDTEEAL